MGLDYSKLENVKHMGSKITARCPACSEMGQDRAGNHLVIYPDGRFGCVQFSGKDGIQHRKRLFQLVGIRKDIGKQLNANIHPKRNIEVKKAPIPDSKVIHANVFGTLGTYKINTDKNNIEQNSTLGHMGRINFNYAHNEDIQDTDNREDIKDKTRKYIKKSVPAVPPQEAEVIDDCQLSLHEEQLLKGVDKETIAKLLSIKQKFHGSIASFNNN